MNAYLDLSADLVEPVSSFEEMTALELDRMITEAWPEDMTITRHPEHSKSPSPSSQPQGSLSPEDGHAEYTPTSSTQQDWGNDVDLQLRCDGFGTSPMFATSTTDESDGISPIDSRSSVYSNMSRPPHSSSHGVSSARRSRGSSPAPLNSNTDAQWASFGTTMNTAGHLSGAAQVPSNVAFDDASINTTESFNESLLSDMTFDYNTPMPIRPAFPQPLSWNDFAMSQTYAPFATDPAPPIQQWSSFPPTAHGAQQPTLHSATHQHTVQPRGLYQPQRYPQNVRSVHQHHLPHYPSELSSTGPVAQRLESIPREAPPVTQPVPCTTQVTTHSQPAYAYSTQLRYAQPSISIDTSGASRPIPLTHIRSARGGAQPRSPEDGKKGGRKKGGHLNPVNKQRVAKMRKTGACWRCAMQRDPVRSLWITMAMTTLLTSAVRWRRSLRSMHERRKQAWQLLLPM